MNNYFIGKLTFVISKLFVNMQPLITFILAPGNIPLQ